MGSEWKQTTIGDELTLQRGFDITRKQQRPGDVPVVSSGGIASYHDTAKQTGPGVIMGRKGSLGTVFYVEQDYWPHDTTLWIKDFHGNDERFSYYFFKDFASHLLSMDVGAANPTLNRNHVHPIEISWPPLPEQKAIAHILGTLDDKIELNRRMNATLEGMAQALFKSWFVDFDPVIDNALAAGNPIPDELAPRAEVRKKALANGTTQQGSLDHQTLSVSKSVFPAAFEYDDELGPIPEGWETQPLYDIADFINGAAYKGADFSDAEDALPVIKIAEVKAGITGQTKFTTINKGDKYRVEDGDILLSWSGNPDTSIDTFIWTNGPGYLNQHIFNVRLHDESERHFVYYQLKYLRSTFAEIARDKQTTGLGHFTAGDMKRLMVFKPTTSVLEQFNAAVSTIYSRGYENRMATKTLTKLRDTLLPKLISGELRMQSIEKSKNI